MSVAARHDHQSDASDAERAAACALAGLGGIGGQSLTLIKAEHGSLAEAVRKGGHALGRVSGLRSDGVASLERAGDLVKRGEWLLEKAAQIGARVVLAGDDDYPELLRGLIGSPPVLYVKGQLAAGGARRVAVVGTRRPDAYGIDRTQAIVDQLCAAGIEVVSGGAEGIDLVAHERALARGGRTAGVIGSGFLYPYPEKNAGLYERLGREGALVSEFALDARGNRTHFPQRNRTMAGLSEAVIITRGNADSGALTTCQSAIRLGRPVFAVPGQVGDNLAAAPNSVLAAGARAVLTGAEVVQALGLNAGSVAPVAPAPVVSKADVSGFPATVQLLYGRLEAGPRHVDKLSAEVGMNMADTLSALLQLELAGLCTARPGKYFLRR